MIEIRNLVDTTGTVLQYRYFVPAADGAGSLSAHGGGWSDWRAVPTILLGSPAASAEPHHFSAAASHGQ